MASVSFNESSRTGRTRNYLSKIDRLIIRSSFGVVTTKRGSQSVQLAIVIISVILIFILNMNASNVNESTELSPEIINTAQPVGPLL